MATKKIRIYELARELGISNEDVLELANELKIGVKSHSSSIEDPMADRVRRLADSKGMRREPVEEPEPEPAEPEITRAQENALRSAESYLEFKGFSKKGLIQQLSSEYGEGFELRDAKWAVNHVDVNWNEQAVRSAESYLEFKAFSCKGLIEQLSSEYGEQFTTKQATYAAKEVGLC